MASIEERKGKNGTAYRVLFRDAEGVRRRVCFDSDYSRSEVEKARRAVEGYLRSKKFEEPLDRETRLFFENATPDVLRRFENVDFDVVRKRKSVRAVFCGTNFIFGTYRSGCERISDASAESFSQVDGNRDDYQSPSVPKLGDGTRLRRRKPVSSGSARRYVKQGARFSSSLRMDGEDS